MFASALARFLEDGGYSKAAEAMRLQIITNGVGGVGKEPGNNDKPGGDESNVPVGSVGFSTNATPITSSSSSISGAQDLVLKRDKKKKRSSGQGGNGNGNPSIGGTPIDAESLENAYLSLFDWIAGSLDILKMEYLPLSFAVFVHVYLDMIRHGFENAATQFRLKYQDHHLPKHSRELLALAQVSRWDQLQELDPTNYVAQVQKFKFNISLSKLALDVFFAFLFDSPIFPLLGIVNRFINLQLSTKEINNQKHKLDPESQASAEIYANSKSSEILYGSDGGALLQLNLHVPPLYESICYPPSGLEVLEATSSNNSSWPGTSSKSSKAQQQQQQRSSSSSRQSPFFQNYEETCVKSVRLIRSKHPDSGKKSMIGVLPSEKPSISFLTFHNGNESMCGMDISWDGSLVSAGYENSRARVWHTNNNNNNNNNNCYTLVGHNGPVYSTSISPDNRFILSGSEDGSVRIWVDNNIDENTNQDGLSDSSSSNKNNRWLNKAVYKRNSLSIPIWDVKFAPYGRMFATAANDLTCSIWISDRNESPIRMLGGHVSDVSCLSWHPNCQYIVTGSSDKTARLHHVETGKCVRVFSGAHVNALHSISISPKGDKVATGGLDSTVVVWDINSGKALEVLKGHGGPILSLAWSPDAKYLSTCSTDNTIRMWKFLTNGSDTVCNVYHTLHTPVQYSRFLNTRLCLAGGAFEM